MASSENLKPEEKGPDLVPPKDGELEKPLESLNKTINKQPDEKKTETGPELKPKETADEGLDIEAAKKFLEEAYGSEKSSIIVDKSIQAPEESPVPPEPEKEKVAQEEFLKAHESPVPSENKEGLKEAPKIIVPEQYNKPREIIKSPKVDIKIEAEKREEEQRKQAEEKAIKFPKEKKEFSEGVVEIKTEEQSKEEQKSIVDDLVEKVQQEKKEREAQVKVAKNELIDLAKGINDAREKKEVGTEASLFEKAKEVFEVATGEKLETIAKEKAKIEAEKEGLKVISKTEFLSQERISQTEGKILQKEWSSIIKDRWAGLSEEEKQEYFGEAKDKKYPATINEAVKNFASDLERKRQSLEKNGISMPREAFYQMMRDGLKPEDTKKVGLWGRLFGKEIKIPPLSKKRKGYSLSKEDFKKETEETKQKITERIKREAKEELDEKVRTGQTKWRGRKQRSAKEIIQETAKKYKAEKEEAIKPEEPEKIAKKSKIEIFSRKGEARSPELIKEMEKIRKGVEADIEKRKETKKRIEDLIKKQKKGMLLTAREIAYLRSLELAKKTEKEK